jgi:S1-C subfamily serine protease
VKIIEKASPSVVNINTVMLMQDAYMNVTPQQGMGSGIIIDPKGYILTNNHIAENAQSMMVSMFDGTKLEGKVVGTDPMSDVAVIKVDTGNSGGAGDMHRTGGDRAACRHARIDPHGQR